LTAQTHEVVVRYMCLVYVDEERLFALSESEHRALDTEAIAYNEELRLNGHYIVADALEPVRAAATIRVQRSTMSVTDGPFAETKEQLGGFILINAKDLNEAIQVASRIPPARFGCIEVRPIKELTT
jgi:hypothetical protein